MKCLPMLHRLFLAAIILPALAGCADDSSWHCQRSSECARDQFCRIGQCIPREQFSRQVASAGIGQPAGPGESEGPPWDSDAQGVDDSDALEGADAASPGHCPGASAPSPAELVINEVLANVPAGPDGDANGDGVRDALEDEFVELVNISEHILDLDGVTLQVNGRAKYQFLDDCLHPKQAAVIFGGGEPVLSGEFLVRVAPRKLSLSNSGASLSVVNAAGVTVDAMSYRDAKPEALVRAPELIGDTFVAHSSLQEERLFSPGRCASGQSFARGCDGDAASGAGDETGKDAPGDKDGASEGNRDDARGGA